MAMAKATPAPVRAKKRVTYTPDEARRSLVYVHKVVLDLIDADYRSAVMTLDERPANEITREMDRLEACVDELALMGVKVEDSCHGVVWFPTRHNEQRAWIVWELEYPDKLTWHYEGDQTSGRPIETFAEDGG